MAPSLLHRVEELSCVDVDDVRLDVLKGLPFRAHNQTSNQGIINTELLHGHALIADLVRQHGHLGWETIYDHAAVHLCARNLPHLTGRALLQTSLRYVHDPDALIAQCRNYALLFQQAGVGRDRFAIKIPFSGAGAAAARVLNKEGIRTLATAVFSLEQAVAASQAGCLFISPYYNEINAHLNPALRPSYEDPALENPMSCRVVHMMELFSRTYKETGEPQPIMIIASFFTPQEIFAMTELGCQHITIPAHLLTTLANTPDTLPPFSPSHTKKQGQETYAAYATPARLASHATTDPLAGPDWDGKLATMDTDYVADKGANLDAFLKRDAFAGKRFEDARVFFCAQEEEAKKVIEKEMAAQGFHPN